MGGMPKLIAVLMVVVFAVAACGEDADGTGTTTTASATPGGQADESVRAYCDTNRRLNEQQRAPTAAELRELSDVAPPGIKREADLVAERFTARGPDAADDPAVTDALEKIESWNEANCPAS
jgi:hypothetical protein